MEHLLNCHGEWLVVLQALTALPVIGLWLKAQFGTVRTTCQHDHSHDDGHHHDHANTRTRKHDHS